MEEGHSSAARIDSLEQLRVTFREEMEEGLKAPALTHLRS